MEAGAKIKATMGELFLKKSITNSNINKKHDYFKSKCNVYKCCKSNFISILAYLYRKIKVEMVDMSAKIL
jgi:hypothetical protein